ncbi:acyl carrier protein [Streptomyces sp. NBC_01481]|uniref:acyl carrier protein n=1 Tax=Streptomyces sp. NBC_01481 TaxID=2975869 RepID=UPI002258F42E|nr:phosphopantetheine-binding protein [Streptomyces sp. NBC_01481]MCX4584732.1 phosphopantetheine-binding protein [Streptomyces sp. NBC_01481]
MTERPLITVSTTSSAQPTAAEIEAALLSFLEGRVKVPVAPDADLFASGAITSLFSLELVVHVETVYGVAVQGDELRMDNFRSVRAMVALIERLRSGIRDGARS